MRSMKKSTSAVVLAVLGTLMSGHGAVIAQPVSESSTRVPALPPSAEDGDAGPATRGLGIVGLPNCPEGATEVFLVTYARDDTETSCATVISCTNLDDAAHAVTCQFFSGFGNLQKGVDASVALGPGETAECATRDPDPTGIFVVNANAATGDFEGKGRICAETTEVACHAHLACSGTGLEGITLIKRES
jgi:hypothetical protein